MTDPKVRAVNLFASAGVICSKQDVLPEAFDELAQRIQADSPIVAYEVAGLAERLRAARVNGSPRPVPTKPLNPQPKPRQDPPKPPPSKPGGGK